MRIRIIKEALEIFGRQGFDSASTREIAGAADVPLPALQYYFGGKEGLYLACADYVAEKHPGPPLRSLRADRANPGGGKRTGAVSRGARPPAARTDRHANRRRRARKLGHVRAARAGAADWQPSRPSSAVRSGRPRMPAPACSRRRPESRNRTSRCACRLSC